SDVCSSDLERLIKVHAVPDAPLLDLGPEVDPDEVPVSLPVSEPPTHLHESVGGKSHPGVDRDGESFDGETPAEFRAADQDLPDTPLLECDVLLGIIGVLGTVDENDGRGAEFDTVDGFRDKIGRAHV